MKKQSSSRPRTRRDAQVVFARRVLEILRERQFSIDYRTTVEQIEHVAYALHLPEKAKVSK